MNRITTVVMAGLVATSMLWGATGADFGMKILPDQATIQGPPSATASGSVDLTVTLTSAIAEVQGWSFGVQVAPGAGAAMHITALASSFEVMHVLNNAKPGFQNLSYFSASDLVNAKGKNDDTTGVCTFADTDIAAITQGVVIDFMSVVSLPIITDYPMANFTVAVTGPTGATDPQAIGTIGFTDLVGNPATPTVVVHGGASLAPDVMGQATIFSKPAMCATAENFSIWMTGGACATGASVESLVTLNFNGTGTYTEVIQGWSFGLCVDDLLVVTDATSAGTGTATVNGGVAPGFNTITIIPKGETPGGVTQGVVIDLMAVNTLPAQNDFSTLRVTMTANVTEENPVANIRTCDAVLGSPATPNVMVVNGASLGGSKFDGVLAQRPSQSEGCCEDALAGDGKACNKPAEFTFSAGAKFNPGNVNGDARLDIADGIYLLSFLFRGGPEMPCEKAGDANGDCLLDATDAVYIIYYQFLNGPEPVWGLGCQTIGNDQCPTLTCNVQDC